MMKLCTVVGARPQFIKAATVSRLVESQPDVEEIIIHTGQHYDDNMSARFFEELSIPRPSYQLNIGSATHGKQTGEMLSSVEEILIKEKPDWVLVYGDTNSTLAGALAAVKLHIPVAHVEAGLRSFNRHMPEEINRIVTDHLSELLFAPTKNGEQQLLKEGIVQDKIINVGDVMYDATLFYNELNSQRETIVEQLNLIPKEYVLSTVHRAENTDDTARLTHICQALIELSQNIKVILPLHPRTRVALQKCSLLDKMQHHIQLIEPVGYLDMLALEQHARIIITDSGGVQKEAYFNQVPCITLRDETEWVELVESGCNQLCSPKCAFSLNKSIGKSSNNYTFSQQLYGSGNASNRILELLL